mgnify:CR=1 FL=1
MSTVTVLVLAAVAAAVIAVLFYVYDLHHSDL